MRCPLACSLCLALASLPVWLSPSHAQPRRADARAASSASGPAGLAGSPSGAVTAGAASAAPAPTGSDPGIEEAKQRYTRALELFQEGSTEASLLEFKRSYELSRSYKLLYNMALVSKQLNDYVGALRYYERYLHEGGSSVEPARRDDVQREIERLRTRVGRVTVTITWRQAPRGAVEITVDDLTAGQAPLPGTLLLNPGRRKVTAQAPGQSPVTRVVEVTGGDALQLVIDLGGSMPEAPIAPAPITIVRQVDGGVPAWPFWLGAGVFAAGGTLTGVLALRANQRASERRGQFGLDEQLLSDDQGRAKNLALTTDVLLGAALVSAGAGLYFTLWGQPSRPSAVAVRLAPGSLWLQGPL